jgi:hypothetical protein
MECPLVAIPREIAPLFVNYLALSHDRWNIPTAGIEPIQSTESVRCCAAESIVSLLGAIGTDAGSRQERQLHDAIFRKEWGDLSPSGITARPPARVISPLSISFGNARIGEADLYRGLSARKNERLRNGRLWRKAYVP